MNFSVNDINNRKYSCSDFRSVMAAAETIVANVITKQGHVHKQEMIRVQGNTFHYSIILSFLASLPQVQQLKHSLCVVHVGDHS